MDERTIIENMAKIINGDCGYKDSKCRNCKMRNSDNCESFIKARRLYHAGYGSIRTALLDFGLKLKETFCSENTNQIVDQALHEVLKI